MTVLGRINVDSVMESISKHLSEAKLLCGAAAMRHKTTSATTVEDRKTVCVYDDSVQKRCRKESSKKHKEILVTDNS